MKKRILLITISTVIIAVICFNTSLSLKQEEKSGTSNLTLSSITALAYGEMTDEEAEYYRALENECSNKGGYFKYDISPGETGYEVILCTTNGQINVFGTTLLGGYTKGTEYYIYWQRRNCKLSDRASCCTKQQEGKFIGDKKVSN